MHIIARAGTEMVSPRFGCTYMQKMSRLTLRVYNHSLDRHYRHCTCVHVRATIQYYCPKVHCYMYSQCNTVAVSVGEQIALMGIHVHAHGHVLCMNSLQSLHMVLYLSGPAFCHGSYCCA